MTTLPYAPRPIAGEGIASWVARLAVQNFMDPAAFCDWLGARDIEDIESGDAAQALAAKTALPLETIGAVAAASSTIPRRWLSITDARGLRGAACPTCCREAAEAGQDHWWSARSEALLIVSCEKHHCSLVAAGQLNMIRTPGGFRLVLPTGQELGSDRRCTQLAGPVLEFERMFESCLTGERPGRRWRLASARSMIRAVELLIGYVLCAPTGELPFADRFDDAGTGGSGVFSVDPKDRRRGVGLLQGQPIRMRCSVMSALHTLLARPTVLSSEIGDALEWRTAADAKGPYRALAQHLGREGRARMVMDLSKLPAPMSKAASAALVAAAYELN